MAPTMPPRLDFSRRRGQQMVDMYGKLDLYFGVECGTEGNAVGCGWWPGLQEAHSELGSPYRLLYNIRET